MATNDYLIDCRIFILLCVSRVSLRKFDENQPTRYSYLQPDINTAFASFVVGVSGSICSRFSHHPPLVTVLSGILLQVPGSLGVKGFTSFIENDVLSGTGTTFQMVYTGLSITVGLFIANLVVFPHHALTPKNVIF